MEHPFRQVLRKFVKMFRSRFAKSFIVFAILFFTIWVVRNRGFYTLATMGNVQRINKTEANALLENSRVQIVDVREAREFETSHIPNAIRFTESLTQQLDKNQPVFVYCTVDVRSNKLAKKLSKAGFKEVYDLKGGIIHWVNKGGEVITESGTLTNQVHTYSKWFAPLLRKGEAVY